VVEDRQHELPNREDDCVDVCCYRAEGCEGIALASDRESAISMLTALHLLILHPKSEEWLYFHAGEARATVFTGNANSRTFNFKSGDTAVFPDNSGMLARIL
jgi:hypothetical protein